MFNEFKQFAMKGNLVDMAVGFVMGGAFAPVVTAFIQGLTAHPGPRFQDQQHVRSLAPPGMALRRAPAWRGLPQRTSTRGPARC